MKTMLTLWYAILISVTAAVANTADEDLLRQLYWQSGQKPEKIYVGDKLRFEVRNVQLTNEQLAEIQVTGISTDDGWLIHADSLKVDKENSQMSFLISPLQSGNKTIPSFQFIINEQEVLFKTSPLSLNVISLLKEKEKPIDVLPAVKLPFPLADLILGISVILILFILMMIFVYKKLNKQKPVKLPEVKKPEHPIDVQAKKFFEKLDSLEYLKDQKFKEHYFGASEILKWFFSKRYVLDAQEATTEEMISLLESKKASKEHVEEIKVFFEELDLIKFTDQKPDLEKAKSLSSRGLKLVEKLMNKIGITNEV